MIVMMGPSEFRALNILRQFKDTYRTEKELRQIYGRSSSIGGILKRLHEGGYLKRKKEGRAYKYKYAPDLECFTKIWYHYSKQIVLPERHGRREPICLVTYWIQKILKKEDIIDENGLFEPEKYPNCDIVRWNV